MQKLSVMPKLVLIDGHAILHRAYHALPPLTNKNGVQTNAIYGFMTMMLRILETQNPTHLAIAFDLPQPTFRQQQYLQYQAKRPVMEGNLKDQIPLVHELLDALKISYFEVSGYEADDVIGTIASDSGRSQNDVLIITGDRDMLQLVNKNVKVLAPVKGLGETKTYDEDLIKREFGVAPNQWVDVKALKGDASDNYPGVRGIGPKTAEKLIQKYGTLENVYKNLAGLDAKLRLKLAEGVESAGMSQKLAKIICDVPLKFDLETAKTQKINWSEGVKYMREKLGFKSIAEKIEKNYLKVVPPEDPQLKLI